MILEIQNVTVAKPPLGWLKGVLCLVLTVGGVFFPVL